MNERGNCIYIKVRKKVKNEKKNMNKPKIINVGFLIHFSNIFFHLYNEYYIG